MTEEIRTQTHRKKIACGYRGRDRSDAATNQGMPQIANKRQKLEEQGRIPPSRCQRNLVSRTLNFRFSILQNCERLKISVVVNHPVCSTLLRQL
jgi:hypothetical protein